MTERRMGGHEGGMTGRRQILAGMAAAASAMLVSRPARVLAANTDLVAAATKEGNLSWYTSNIVNQLARPIAQAFERKYPGIKVAIVSGTNGDLYQKMVAEAQTGRIRADVSHGFSIAPRLVAAGLLERYEPDAAKDYPAELKDPAGHYIAHLSYFSGTAVNTELVKPADIPRSLEDLLDPRWRGRLVWAGGALGGTPTFLGAVLDEMGPNKGAEFLQKLSEQGIASLPANRRVILDNVMSGEYLVAVNMYVHHVAISKGKGAPIDMAPILPYRNTADYAFILKNSPNPNAAKLFYDFILSEDAQGVVARAGYVPAHPLVSASASPIRAEVAGRPTVTISPEYAYRHTDDWNRLYNRLFVKG